MKIQVLGPGCPKCAKAEKIVKEAVLEAGLEIEVVKISDFQEIASYGVFSTPAVAIDGEVKIVGRVPSKNDVLGWITG
ncbi:thioredoxin family protein [Maridesulfovibrio ferrireducens]|uniref:thioredoxin family protein n=1 Tax=Maridesulfovibrio ferrireducens TaxID=246191 RepID=UPI001A310385|nr:thioredoxin family protein [Maridesulfovibrio ferrireducens]MBI9111835.1 TM0996/MTH895 family glutaredoxin-like protein [Maridesulfovibrio ferrireducens]